MNRSRRFTGGMGKVVTGITTGFGIYSLLYLGGVFHWLGIYIYDTSHPAIIFGFVLVFTFLKIPAYGTAPRDRLPWYDVILILLSIAGSSYIAIQAKSLALGEPSVSLLQKILGIITVVVVLEAARRAVSPILTILGALFFIYPMFADKAPGFLERPAWGLDRVVAVQYLYPTGIFGSTMHVLATIILAFTIFGVFLQVSGAANSFINLSLSLAGRFRGGPAKVAIVASALFGSINGSTLANVATTGTVTIPLMKSIGYKPTFAGAVEAVASTGGPVTPPVMGATAFMIMDFLGISYARVMLAAVVPCILFYLGLYIMVDHEAVKNNLKGIPAEQIPPLRQVLKDAWFCLVPLSVIVFLLVFLKFTPATSGIAAIVSLVLASMFRKGSRMGLGKIGLALAGSGEGLPQIGSAIAVAGILMGAFSLSGLVFTLSNELIALAGGNLTILMLAVTIFLLILGMGLSGVAVYLIGAIFLVPAMTTLGVNPLAAHFFVFWMAHAALITPPVCNAAYLAGAIAGAPLMRTGWQACRLGIVVYLMAVVWLYDPAMLIIGSAMHIGLAIISAMAGVYFVSCGVSGRMLKSASWPERILFMAGGGALFFPGWHTLLGGLGAVALPVLWQVRQAAFVKAEMARTGRAVQPGDSNSA